VAQRALCVGINDYPGSDMDLSGCVNDAADWRALLEARGYRVDSLLNGDATRTRMLDALRALVSPRTRIVAFNHVSNALGTINPVADIAAIARGYGFEALTARSVADLAPVAEWVAGPRAAPLLIDAKVTRGEPSWWLEEAFRGH